MSGRVTITLGRAGQVVKRDGADLEGTSRDRGGRGAKRSVKDRLGDGNETWNKRQRREDARNRGGADMNDSSFGAPYATKDHRIGQNDLRLKLMHKNLSKQMDNRDKHHPDRPPCQRYSQANQSQFQFSDRSHMSASRSPTHLRRIPPTRSEDDFLSLRRSQQPWSSDGPRHRPPDRLVRASRPLSPPRRHDMVPSIRSMEPPMQRSYMPRSTIDSSRHAPYMDKASNNVPAPKNVMHPPGHPPSSIPPKSSFTFEEPLTVAGLLNALGLGKYAILFQAEEVDMAALKQMSDNDLKDLGIPMQPRLVLLYLGLGVGIPFILVIIKGKLSFSYVDRENSASQGPRKKILLAVGPRTKQKHG